MPRPRKIWPKSGRNHYYTKIDGKVTRLGPLKKGEAFSLRILEKILRGTQQPAGRGEGMTFARLADKFLGHSQATNEEETYDVHRLFLQSFKDHVGRRPVSKLCEADLDEWCREHAAPAGKVKAGGKKGGTREGKAWSESTQARARAIVLAALNYGVKKLNMPPHPLQHVRPGTVGNRERYLTEDERKAIRGTVKGVFADYVFALEQTGARPFSEVCKVTAADVDLAKRTWTLTKWKNSKKQKGKKRVIFLSLPMVELTRRLMAKNPEGPLFRCQQGTPWSRQSITARFRALSERLGMKDVTAYTFRHTAISDALIRGVPVAVVAELFGTSIQTISRSYAHIDKREDVLLQAMEKAVG
jgi:integrase